VSQLTSLLYNRNSKSRRQEKVVITVEIYKEIRKLRLEGLSQRRIADRLGISRNTVKKYWDGGHAPWERKPYSRTANVMTEDITEFILDCIR
jgi:predicted transcriptional regulator